VRIRHVGATGKRAAALAKALQVTGLTPVAPAAAPPRPSPPDLPDAVRTELLGLYRQLGGTAPTPLLRPGSWDLAFTDGLVVELDEELHFNRYRAATLAASWEVGLPWTKTYLSHCAQHEHECWDAGRWGSRWTNPSAAKAFTGGPAGQLDDGGAPRWKQRAIYDALKDTVKLVEAEVRLARVATHDTIDGTQLGDMLAGKQPTDPAAIRQLVDSRRS
jgi:hypothetical protein